MNGMDNATGIGLSSLIEREIPEGRQNLENSYSNLERVAAYCEANYIQAADKNAAFEETKRYTIQSLASVAYQINTLASNLLQMLELQTEKIGEMESHVSNLSQVVSIHHEKIARREIGVLTTNKVIPRQHKLIPPAQQEKPGRYVRGKIDYSVLDDLGHGVRVQPSQPHVVARTGSSVSAGSSGSGGSNIPLQNMPTYPASPDPSHYKAARYSSVSKGTSKEYRTPVTAAPPTAPSAQNAEYLQRYHGLVQTNSYPAQIQQQQQQRKSSQSSSGMANGGQDGNNYGMHFQQQPQYEAYGANAHHPMSSLNNNNSVSLSSASAYAYYNTHTANTVAYAQQQQQHHHLQQPQQPYLSASNSADLPPPPPSDFIDYIDDVGDVPPPPPPIHDYSSAVAGHHSGGINIYQQFQHLQQQQPMFAAQQQNNGRRGSAVPDWVPPVYVEKVVAVFDYQAEKDDELTFQENAVIYVLKKNEDGWFEGVLNGATGLFPGNYVESCI